MVWVRVALFASVAVVVASAVWRWAPEVSLTADELADFVGPHRRAWYGLPVVVLMFVLLGLLLVPVLALIGVTGIAFGPVLGPVYALAGAVASAASGFAIGRVLRRRRVDWLRTGRLARLDRLRGVFRRHGTLAVFVVRKIPAPFTLVNVALGASAVDFKHFVAGTVLGIAPSVVALAGLGSQLGQLFSDPSPAALARAALFLLIPLTMAAAIDRALRRARGYPGLER